MYILIIVVLVLDFPIHRSMKIKSFPHFFHSSIQSIQYTIQCLPIFQANAIFADETRNKQVSAYRAPRPVTNSPEIDFLLSAAKRAAASSESRLERSLLLRLGICTSSILAFSLRPAHRELLRGQRRGEGGGKTNLSIRGE